MFVQIHEPGSGSKVRDVKHGETVVQVASQGAIFTVMFLVDKAVDEGGGECNDTCLQNDYNVSNY